MVAVVHALRIGDNSSHSHTPMASSPTTAYVFFVVTQHLPGTTYMGFNHLGVHVVVARCLRYGGFHLLFDDRLGVDGCLFHKFCFVRDFLQKRFFSIVECLRKVVRIKIKCPFRSTVVPVDTKRMLVVVPPPRLHGYTSAMPCFYCCTRNWCVPICTARLLVYIDGRVDLQIV